MANDYPRVLQLLNRDGFFDSGSVLDSAIYPVNKLNANIENFALYERVWTLTQVYLCGELGSWRRSARKSNIWS